MPEEGKENEKVRESESEKVAEPLPANKKRPQIFHGNKSKLAPEKIASARTQKLLRLRRSIGLC